LTERGPQPTQASTVLFFLVLAPQRGRQQNPPRLVLPLPLGQQLIVQPRTLPTTQQILPPIPQHTVPLTRQPQILLRARHVLRHVLRHVHPPTVPQPLQRAHQQLIRPRSPQPVHQTLHQPPILPRSLQLPRLPEAPHEPQRTPQRTLPRTFPRTLPRTLPRTPPREPQHEDLPTAPPVVLPARPVVHRPTFRATPLVAPQPVAHRPTLPRRVQPIIQHIPPQTIQHAHRPTHRPITPPTRQPTNQPTPRPVHRHRPRLCLQRAHPL
jgi:hypothetical protein